MGAMMNKNLSDPLGIKFSLNKRDIKSAIGCNNPNGPHLFGPILVWKRPSKRLSPQVIRAVLTKKIFTRNNENIIPVEMVANQQGITPDITLWMVWYKALVW